jgi:catechol 2,3-dioxygenase-like lactoylglutathione lyase family enzyme
MKRFHVHLGVPDLSASIRFYSDLFGMPPSVQKPDYAKWMLEDPRVNFAISHRAARPGLNHLGFQAESADELAEIRTRFASADDAGVYDEPTVSCCYARGNKHWTKDPQGIAWEAFHTLDRAPMYDGESTEAEAASACGSTATQCCGPSEATAEPAPRARAGCCT